MRRLTLVITALCVLFVGACSPDAEGGISYKPHFSPFKLVFDSTGRLSVELDREIVTPFGEFGISAGLGQDLAPQRSPSTMLYVYTYVDGALTANVFEILTGRKLAFIAEGKLYGEVAEGKMELRADPGVPTTIEVFDPDSDERATTAVQPPYVPLPPDWEFQLPNPLGKSWAVDIDSRKSLYTEEIDSSHSDLLWDYGYGLYSLQTLGLAPASVPTPEQCRDAARSNAAGKVPVEEVRVGQAYCVESDNGNLAWVRITQVSREDDDPAQATVSLTAAVWIKTAK